ncbi:hypothetical protein CL689_03660 [Candidatus Saccharibacteria bacterium]|nr:hypothetical protein [Candidatus Saccharibacteria bacterium]|tara:strand:- start:1427 stop:2758 length:1332 start_codon:yes stop_codon:yes gene_type:complete
MKAAKLTTFGKIVIVTVVAGALGTLAEMGYGSYKIREAVSAIQATDEVLDSSVTFQSLRHEAFIFQSSGHLRATIEDACNADKNIAFNMHYKITHLPYLPDQFEATVSREVVASGLKKSRVAKDGDDVSVVVQGKFESLEDFQAHAVIKQAKWVNQNSGSEQTLEDATVELNSNHGDYLIDFKGKAYGSMDGGQKSSFENFNVNAKLQPNKSTFLKVTAKADKYKGPHTLVMNPLVEGSLNVTDNKAVGALSLVSPLLSLSGSPAENLSLNFSANVNDFTSLRKMKTIFDAECDQLKLDEEDKINQAIYASRLVESGIEARITNVSWGGPRGTASGSASVGVSRVLDKQTGLPDIYAGLVADGQLRMDEGYEGLAFVDKLVSDKFLKKDRKELHVKFSMKEKSLVLNGQKDESLTTEYGSLLNDYFDKLAPAMESALSINKVR